MHNSILKYKLTGIHRLTCFKSELNPTSEVKRSTLNDFVNLFCEYQLADNNYMNVHLEAIENGNNENWYTNLSVDQALRLLTYIIWTDKLSPGYLPIKVNDKTVYHTLNRLENIVSGSILVSPGN